MPHQTGTARAHVELIKLMTTFNYHPDQKGMCRGIALSGLDAFYSEDLDTYLGHMNWIEKNKNLSSQLEAFSKKMLHANGSKVALSEDEIKCQQLFVFMDRIKRQQFEKLEKLDYLKVVKTTIGVYTAKTLFKHLDLLAKAAMDEKQNIGFTFNDAEHRLTICFDVCKGWSIINGNEFPIPRNLNTQALVEKIIMGFEDKDANKVATQDKVLALTTTFFATDANVKKVAAIVKKWEQHPEISQIHQLTKENANIRAQHGCNLSYLAVHAGLKDKLEELHPLVDLNLTAINETSLAILAAQQGDLAMLQKISEYQFNLQQVKSDGTSPAYFAAQLGHAHVITGLAKLIPNVNVARKDGDTPLLIATRNGHVSVVNALLELGVACNDANQLGVTAACYAAENGNLELLQLFITAGVDLTQKTPCGKSPMDVAKDKNHQHIIQFIHLKKHEATIMGYLQEKIIEEKKVPKKQLLQQQVNHFRQLEKNPENIVQFVNEIIVTTKKPKHAFASIFHKSAHDARPHPLQKIATHLQANSALSMSLNNL